jgi:hypothetical protein
MGASRFALVLAIAAFTSTSPADPMDCHVSPPPGFLDADHQALSDFQSVPELGWYVVEGATLHVFLTQPTDEALERAVLAIRRFDPELVWSRVAMGKADYCFSQLVDWCDHIPWIEGMITTDVDWGGNRLVVGVLSRDLEPAVRRNMTEAGIPNAAVLVEVRAPIELLIERAPDRPWTHWQEWAASLLVALVGLSLVRTWRARPRAT